MPGQLPCMEEDLSRSEFAIQVHKNVDKSDGDAGFEITFFRVQYLLKLKYTFDFQQQTCTYESMRQYHNNNINTLNNKYFIATFLYGVKQQRMLFNVSENAIFQKSDVLSRKLIYEGHINWVSARGKFVGKQFLDEWFLEKWVVDEWFVGESFLGEWFCG